MCPKAHRARTCKILTEWQQTGARTLTSAAAPEIAKAIPRDYLAVKGLCDPSGGSLLRIAADRFFAIGLPHAKTRWSEQIARIPRTTRELKRHLKRRYREGERVALELLATEGSIASINYCQRGLNGAILKECMKRLRRNRREQVVLANIICATNRGWEAYQSPMSERMWTGGLTGSPFGALQDVGTAIRKKSNDP